MALSRILYRDFAYLKYFRLIAAGRYLQKAYKYVIEAHLSCKPPYSIKSLF